MPTLELPSTDTSASTSGPNDRPVSAGWLIRRTALWMLLVGLGVAGSCLLYMAANTAEADSDARPAVASAAGK
jgi:hypothetical protein